MSIRVTAFGPIVVHGDDYTIGARDFGGWKPKQLFELLFLARPNAVAKARLAEDLWPHTAPKNMTATLETYVSVLRRRLGGEDLVLGHALITTEHEAYRLDPVLVSSDVDEFVSLLASSIEEPDDIALKQIEAAIALADGELFADEPYSRWVQEDRDRYQQRVLDARVDAAALCLRTEQFRAALGHVHATQVFGRLDERAVRLGMIAEYALGEQRAALKMYEECRNELIEDLGVDPARATVELHGRILRQEPLDSLLPQRTIRNRTESGVSHRDQQDAPLEAPSSISPQLDTTATRTGTYETAKPPTLPEMPDTHRQVGDPMALHVLLGSCELALRSGGVPAALLLLRGAHLLAEALQGKGDQDTVRELYTWADASGASPALERVLTDAAAHLHADCPKEREGL
jgi:DNA-binding SARP family transcriptional activator